MIAVVSSGHKPDDERIYHKEIQSLLKAGYEIQYFTRSNSEISLSKKNLIHCNVPPIKYNIKDSLINPSFFVIADMSFNWNQFIN